MHAQRYAHTNRLSTIKIVWDYTNTYYRIGEGTINYQIKFLYHRTTTSSSEMTDFVLFLTAGAQLFFAFFCCSSNTAVNELSKSDMPLFSRLSCLSGYT
jgi:hypothetical protein